MITRKLAKTILLVGQKNNNYRLQGSSTPM